MLTRRPCLATIVLSLFLILCFAGSAHAFCSSENRLGLIPNFCSTGTCRSAFGGSRPFDCANANVGYYYPAGAGNTPKGLPSINGISPANSNTIPSTITISVTAGNAVVPATVPSTFRLRCRNAWRSLAFGTCTFEPDGLTAICVDTKFPIRDECDLVLVTDQYAEVGMLPNMIPFNNDYLNDNGQATRTMSIGKASGNSLNRFSIFSVYPSLYIDDTQNANKNFGPMTITGHNFGPSGFYGHYDAIKDRFETFSCRWTNDCCRELYVIDDTMMVCTALDRDIDGTFDVQIRFTPSSWSGVLTPASGNFDTLSLGSNPTVTAAVWPAAGQRKASGGAFTVTIYGTNLAGTATRTIPPVLRFGSWPCFGPYMYSHTGTGGLTLGETYTGSATMMTCVMGPGIGTNLELKFNFKFTTFNTGQDSYFKTASPRKVLSSDVDLTLQTVKQFDFDPPELDAVTPLIPATPWKATRLTINGANFGADHYTYNNFANAHLPITAYTVTNIHNPSSTATENLPLTVKLGTFTCGQVELVSDTRIVCTPPVGQGTNLDVLITVGGQTNTVSAKFSYNTPEVTALFPTALVAGDPVTIFGNNFDPSTNTVAIINDSAPLNVGACSSPANGETRVVCTVPAGCGTTVSVKLTATSSVVATFSGSKVSYAAPTVSTRPGLVGPYDSVPTLQPFTLTGTNFPPATCPPPEIRTVIDGKVNTCGGYSGQSNVQIVCTIPPKGVSTTRSLVFWDGSPAGQITYKAPAVSTLTPAAGNPYFTADTPAVVTINGSNFGGDDYASLLAVTIGGSACTTPQWLSETRITCTFPKGTGVARTVSVSFTGGAAGTANIFSYDRPIISTVVPAVGPQTTPGATITLTGVNFGTEVGSVTVSVGTFPCTPLVSLADDEVKCTMPAGVGKDLNVVLTASSQASAIAAQKYSFPAPVLSATVATTVPTDTATWTLTLNGDHFGPASTPAKVTFTPPLAAPVSTTLCTASTETRIVCSGAMLAGYGTKVDVKVEVGAQESNVLVDAVTYDRPTIASFTPPSIDANMIFTINGANFGPVNPGLDVFGADVEISTGVWSSATQVTWVSSTQLVVKAPADPAFGCNHKVKVFVPKVDNLPNTVFGATLCYLPPVISSLSVGTSPPHNTLSTVLTVFGKNFGDATSNKKHTITIGTIPCAVKDAPPDSWFSDTAVFCVIPNGVGKDLSVIVSVGGQGDTEPLLFTYTAPSITDVVPKVKFSTLGSEAFTILGTNLGYPGLAAGLMADAGGYGSSTSCTAFSSAELRCETLAGSGKGLAVTLKSSNYAPVSLAGAFTYKEPVMGSISPSTLDVMDTTTVVTLTGSGFGTKIGGVAHSITASIDGVPMTGCVWVSDAQARCNHAVGIGGGLDVSVTVDAQVGTKAALFTHKIPEVSTITPDNYPTATGGTVTIAGKNFGPTTPPGAYTREVNVGPYLCSSPVFNSDNSIVCTMPGGTGKGHPVMVTVASLINTSLKYFSYNPPKITSLTQLPSYECIPIAPNNILTINGVNFGPSAALISVTLDTSTRVVPCTPVAWVSDSKITCPVPKHAGSSVSVQVTVDSQPDASSALVRVTYTPPSIISVTPAASDCMPGGALMTVVGKNFGPDTYEGIADSPNKAQVTINGWSCVTTLTARSDTQIICAIPQGVGINRPVTVTVGGSVSAPSAGALFSYNPPSVTELASPPAGPKKGLTFITITGKNFGGVPHSVLEVFIAGYKCTTPVLVSDSRITCTTGSAYATPDPKPKALGANALIVYSDGQNSVNPGAPFYTYLEFTSDYCKKDVDNEYPVGRPERERLKEEYFRNIAPLDENNLPNLLTPAGQWDRTGTSDPGTSGCPGTTADHCYSAAVPPRNEGANFPRDLVDKDRCCANINTLPCGLHWKEAASSVTTNMKQVSMVVKKKAYINGILVTFFNPCVNEALPVYNLFINGGASNFYQRTTGVSDTPCNVIPGNSGAVSICQDYFKGEILNANNALKLVFDNKYNVPTSTAGGGGWMMEFEMHGIFENSPYEVRADAISALTLPSDFTTIFQFKASTMAYKAFTPTAPLDAADTETLKFTAWAQGPDPSTAYVAIATTVPGTVLDGSGKDTLGIERPASLGSHDFLALSLATPKVGDYKFTFGSPGLKSFVATVTVVVGAPNSIMATRIDFGAFKTTDTVTANLVQLVPPILVQALDPGLNLVTAPGAYGDITVSCGGSTGPAFAPLCGHTTVTGPTVPMVNGEARFGSSFGTSTFINEPHRGTYDIQFTSTLTFGSATAPLVVLPGDPAAIFVEDAAANALGIRDSTVTVRAAQFTQIKRPNGDPITTKLMDAGYHPLDSLVQPSLTTAAVREYFVTIVGAGGAGIPKVLTAGSLSATVTSGPTNQPKYDWFSILLFEPKVGTYTLLFDSPAPASPPPLPGWNPGQATVLSPAKLTVVVVLGDSVKGLVEMIGSTTIPSQSTTTINTVSVFGVDGGNNKAFTAGPPGVYPCNAYLNDTKNAIVGTLDQTTINATANFTDLKFSVPPKIGRYFVHVKCTAFQPAYPIPFGVVEVVFGTAVALSAENVAEWDVPYRTDFVIPLKTFSVWAVDAGGNKVPTQSGDMVSVDTGANALQTPVAPIALSGGYANFSGLVWSNVQSGGHLVWFRTPTSSLKPGVANVTITKGFVGTKGSTTEGVCDWITDFSTTNNTRWDIKDTANRANAHCLFVSKRVIQFGTVDVLALNAKLEPVSGSGVSDRVINYQLEYVSFARNPLDPSLDRRIPEGWDPETSVAGRVVEPQYFSHPTSKMTAGVSTVPDFEIKYPFPGTYRLFMYTDPIGVGGTIYNGYLRIDVVPGLPAALRIHTAPPDVHERKEPSDGGNTLAVQPLILITDITDNVVKVPAGVSFLIVARVFRPTATGIESLDVEGSEAKATADTVRAQFTKLGFKGTRGENYTVEFSVATDGWTFENVTAITQMMPCNTTVAFSERDPANPTECHCSPGYYKNPQKTSQLYADACIPCEDGTFKNISGWGACTTCASLNPKDQSTKLNTRTYNFYENTTENEEDLLTDPIATTDLKLAQDSGLGASSPERCRCDKDFYSLPSEPGICLKCSEGGVCKGGSRIVPAPGFWRLNDNSTQFFECIPADACPGGVKGECKEGYFGPLCSKCKERYGKVGLECQECPEQKYSWPIFAASILVVVGVIAFLIRSQKNTNWNYTTATVIQKILLNYMQMLSLFGSFAINWPPQVTRMFQISEGTSSFSQNLYTVDCAVKSSYFRKLLLYLVIPILGIIMPLMIFTLWHFTCKGICFLIRRPYYGTGGDVLNNSLLASMIIIFMTHPTVSRQVFNVFNCRQFETEEYLVEDLSVDCKSQEYLFWKQVCLIVLFTFCLGVPIYGYILLFFLRKKLTLLKTRSRFGFLYIGLRTKVFYWEMVTILRKLGVVYCVVFVNDNTVHQIFAALWLVQFAILGHLVFKPFEALLAQRLELASLFSGFCTLMVGLMFDENVGFSDKFKWYLISAIFLANGTTFLLLVTFLIRGKIIMRLTKSEKVIDWKRIAGDVFESEQADASRDLYWLFQDKAMHLQDASLAAQYKEPLQAIITEMVVDPGKSMTPEEVAAIPAPMVDSMLNAMSPRSLAALDAISRTLAPNQVREATPANPEDDEWAAWEAEEADWAEEEQK